jgi:uncharacterized membrane protein YphA (DoxX/SURF4 family)
MNRALWIVQILLALLFLSAGAVKLITPVEQIAQQMHMSATFIRFIGVCEVLGTIGLILPRLLRIKPWLTPLAAALLVVIMIGATVVTWQMKPGPGALFPFVTGLLCAFVAYGRCRVAP